MAKTGRPRNTVDMDDALEQAAFVVSRAVQRAEDVQAGRATAIKELSSDELDGVIKALRALADVQNAVEAAMDKKKASLTDLNEEQFYETLLAKAKELGRKLGRKDFSC